MGTGRAPVAPRDAATLVLARDEGAGLEIFMLRRSVSAAFAGGAYVFPGGTVAPEDRHPGLEALCVGRADADASARLGIASGGLTFWIAAIRECFEEAGLLLARHAAGGQMLAFSDPDVEARFQTYRRALAAGARRLEEILRAESLVLDVGNVHYFSHWITPADAPRRYDTRFFIAPAPWAQRPLHDAREMTAGEWIRPTVALDRFRRGSFELIIPTRRHLEALAEFHRAADLLGAARAVTHVPTIVPAAWADEARGQAPTGLTSPPPARDA
ncbi:MAG: NUDIX hydrolase [Armatimonadetes bacterium]|nr:NUDIX hydrolase [Armatimonadota bacterium]